MFKSVFGKYLIGKIVECAIIGLLYLIILPLLGVPYPFLITIIMTAIVPAVMTITIIMLMKCLLPGVVKPTRSLNAQPSKLL